MAERLMVNLRSSGDAAGMDEATIDCAICGRHGDLEVQLQRLTDLAEWRTAHAWVVCRAHVGAVRIDPAGLEFDQRLVMMPLR